MRIEADDALPEGLVAAFERYERALAADDLTELDALFETGDATIRTDPAGVVVGHAAISAFRRSRGGAPARTVAVLHARVLTPELVVLVALLRPAAGGSGQQTQVWRRSPDHGWRIAVAHVSATPAAIDGRVWRVAGAPLLPGRPAPQGPGDAPRLDGERVAVKDLFAVEGQRIGAGVPAFLAEAPVETRTATAVQVLLDAGAAVAGIARTDELAYSIAGANPHYGTPPNPAVPGGLPGGSSSGPASAVALGHATIGLATDTAGSIRVPASYQGLWGLRTTHGAVPVDGLLPLAPGFDAVGWLTRDPALLARVAEVTLGAGRPVGARLAVAPALLAPLDDGVRTAFEAVLDGGAVEEADLGDPDAAYEAFRTVQAFEAWRTHGAWIERHPGALRGGVAERFAWASTVHERDADAARQRLTELRAELRGLLERAVLVLPSAASAAPPADADGAAVERARAQTLRLTCFASIAGVPAVSAPLVALPGGPLGVSFLGRPGSDGDLVRLAAEAAPA
jgi:Asp-tRNA(Asn)/Glu-tRNA(Gln) amidotransferase A subunit family amidase